MRIIDAASVDAAMSWPRVVEALRMGHLAPKPQIADHYFSDATGGLLMRGAWISGLGACVKAATVFPANPRRNPPLPSILGSVLLFDPETGVTLAVVDGAKVTKWKTAGDSALGASYLSRPDSRSLLMVGAGAMAEPLIRAHVSVRPSIERITIWNRSRPRAAEIAARVADLGRRVGVADDLATAVAAADTVCAATLSKEPLIKGGWLQPGTHVDLVGAYKPDMREADDDAVRRARIFVDYCGTTIGHIGELMQPIAAGVIAEADVIGDLYDLAAGVLGRRSADEITLYKNGGGGHLDLMTSRAILEAVGQQN